MDREKARLRQQRYRESGRYAFFQYQIDAKRRNRVWELSQEAFDALLAQPCHYCGAAKSGIDRKDNNRGYTLANSLPCCGRCNRAKGTMPYNEFIAYLDRLVVYRGMKYPIPNDLTIPDWLKRGDVVPSQVLDHGVALDQKVLDADRVDLDLRGGVVEVGCNNPSPKTKHGRRPVKKADDPFDVGS